METLSSYGYVSPQRHSPNKSPEHCGRGLFAPVEVSVPRTFQRDVDLLVDVLGDDSFEEVARSVATNQALPNELELGLIVPPYVTAHEKQINPYSQLMLSLPHDETDSGSSSSSTMDNDFSDFSQWLCSLDDTSSTTKRIKQANYGQFEEVAFIDTKAVEAHAAAQQEAVAKVGPQKSRRSKPATPRRRGPIARANTAVSPRSKVAASPKAVSSKVEFERILSAVATELLQVIVNEIKLVREAKERMYISNNSRPPEHAIRDPVDGRPYVFKKVLPHQHKPEKVGDPSPKCFACAARMMEEKATSLLKQRLDQNESQEASSEQVAEARKTIISALGLPADSQVFEYEIVASN